MNTYFAKNPIVGTPLTPSVIKQINTAVRRFMPIAGNGIRTSVTAGGTIISVIPAPARNVRGSASPDMGCWKIVGATREEEGEGETVEKAVHVFANQFYIDGEHNLTELELDDAVEDFVCQGELGDGEEYTADDKPFVALKVSVIYGDTTSPELVGYKTLAELRTAQNDTAFVIKPLYKFTHDGAVAVDFRNVPCVQVAEVL